MGTFFPPTIGHIFREGVVHHEKPIWSGGQEGRKFGEKSRERMDVLEVSEEVEF